MENIEQTTDSEVFIPTPVLEGLTDKELIELSNGEVTDFKDYELSSNAIHAIPGGLFDEVVFGALKQCSCGTQTKFGKCPVCGGEVVSMKNYALRTGHYVMNYPYISSVKITAFLNYMKSLSEAYDILSKTPNGKRVPPNSQSAQIENLWNYRFDIVPLGDDESTDLYTFNADGVLSKLYISPISEGDSGEDFTHYGLVGLSKLIPYIPNIGRYINQVLPIASIAMRPVRINRFGEKSIQFDPLNQYYVAVIQSDKLINQILPNIEKLEDRLVLLNMISSLVNELFSQYKIVAHSKESLIRGILTRRVGQSGRAVIVGCPDLQVNRLRLPRSLSYYAARDEIIKRLRNQGYTRDECISMYDAKSEVAVKLFDDEIIPNCCVAFCRNPTISKNSVTAFRVELWDEIAIGIPLLACKQYNADFDGDTMAFWFVFNSIDAERTMQKMGVENNWFFESTGNATMAPNGAILQGLYLSSNKVRYGSDNIKSFDTVDQVFEARKNREIQVDEEILLYGESTTFGRENISKIMQIDYDILLGNHPINAANIGKLMSAIYSKNNKVDILKDLLMFSGDTLTRYGSTSLSLTDIFEVTVQDEEYHRILNSDETNEVKFAKLVELMPKIIKKQIKELSSDNLQRVIDSSGRIKLNQLVETLGPRLEYDARTGDLIPFEGSLGLGTTESSFISYIEESRDILGLKKNLIPDTGYLQRQLADLCGEYLFTRRPSESTTGAILKKKDAVGRILVSNGEVIPENDSDEFVRVVSCIDNPTNYISYEELNQDLPEYRKHTDNDAIGLSFASAASQDLIQGALGLKHGGSLKSPSKVRLVSMVDGTIISRDDKWLTIEGTNGTLYRYPVPSTIIWDNSIESNIVRRNQVLGYEDRIIDISQNLTNTLDLLGAFKNVSGISPDPKFICYAPDSGVIRYNLDKENPNKWTVSIGNTYFKFNKNLFYVYPDGYKVEKGSRISNGVLNVEYFQKLTKDIGWTYYAFYSQIKELTKLATKSDLMEVIFKGYASRGNFSVRKSMNSHPSLITQMKHSYGAKQILSKFVDKPIGDGFSTNLLLNR